MHLRVHCSTIYNNQTWKQPKCPLTGEWYVYTEEWYIYEEDVHIYNGILPSHVNE